MLILRIKHMDTYQKIFAGYKSWLSQDMVLSLTTINHYLRITENFLKFLAALKLLRLNDVDAEVITLFSHFNAAKKPYALSFINVRLAALNYFFNWTYANGLSRANPVLSYKRGKIKPKPLVSQEGVKANDISLILQPIEQQQLFSYQTTSDFIEIRNKSIAIIILSSALFIEEVIALTEKDIDLNDVCIKIRGEEHRCRNAIIDPNGIKICKVWLKVRKLFLGDYTIPWLFFTQELTPLTRRSLYRMVSDFMKTAGIRPKRCGPEILRQTAIWNMVNRYMIDDVKEFTGIKTLAQLEKYRTIKPK